MTVEMTLMKNFTYAVRNKNEINMNTIACID